MSRWLVAFVATVAIAAIAAIPSRAAAHTCEGGCDLENRACRVDSCFGCAGARALCIDVARDCTAGCEGDRGICRDVCQEAAVECRDACAWSADADRCRIACDDTREFCRTRCGGTREDCALWCGVERFQCVAAAKRDRKDANTQCTTERTACGDRCTNGDECVGACTRASAVCFVEARGALRTCQAGCADATGSVDCPHACRAVQVGANTDCDLTLKTCLGECGPQLTPTEGAVSTTTTPEPSSFLEFLDSEQ